MERSCVTSERKRTGSREQAFGAARSGVSREPALWCDACFEDFRLHSGGVAAVVRIASGVAEGQSPWSRGRSGRSLR